ncbi:MAG: hypothetical protein WC178_04890 [Candidatus Paceibacterota bacterium]
MKNKNAILLASVIILGLLIGGIYLKFLKNNNTVTESKEPISNQTNPAKYENEIASDLSSWQEEWVDYKSQLGISFKYPKFITGLDSCNSERIFFVPMRVFEDTENGSIYITPEYYYDGTVQNGATQNCKKHIISSDSLQREATDTHKPFLGWNIVMKKIENEDIDSIIKNIYGSGCKMESEKPWTKDGMNEVRLNSYKDAEGNPTGLDQTVCPTNYSYKILYSEKQKLAISVALGQECTFWGDNHNECFDEQLLNSFELEKSQEN